MQCNPKVKDVFEYINTIAPFETQCEWDNSGLLVGNAEEEVSKMGVVLDITSEAVEYANKNGINLIISHHPVIFRAVKSFLDGDVAFELAKNGISAICAHTCLDITKVGVNKALADALGIDNSAPLTDSGELSMIRVADIPETDGFLLAKYVAKKLDTGVRVSNKTKKIRKIALCGGSGGDFINDVANAGCDAYITGDLSHHEFLDATEKNICLIAAGHFETENPVVAVLAEKLRENFECGVEIIPQNPPVDYYFNNEE